MTSKAAKLDHKDLASSPRRPETLPDAIEALSNVSKEAAESLAVYLSMYSDYEKEYEAIPDQVDVWFQNIQKDRDDILGYLDDLDDKSRAKLADAVEDLLLTVEYSPVLTYSLKFLRRYCDIPSMIAPEEDNEPLELRYKIQNLLWDAEDKKRLLKELGFVFHSTGKGSHNNWQDKVTGEMLSICDNSEYVSVKEIIKEILRKKISLERIKAAFDGLKIPFKIIKS